MIQGANVGLYTQIYKDSMKARRYPVDGQVPYFVKYRKHFCDRNVDAENLKEADDNGAIIDQLSYHAAQPA